MIHFDSITQDCLQIEFRRSSVSIREKSIAQLMRQGISSTGRTAALGKEGRITSNLWMGGSGIRQVLRRFLHKWRIERLFRVGLDILAE